MGLDKSIPFSYSIGDSFQLPMATHTPIAQNDLFAEITTALEDLRGWGSVEIFVQNGKVTQITRRSIRKTEHEIIQLTQNAPS